MTKRMNNTIDKYVGQKIREFRDVKNLDLEVLAEKTGINPKTLQNAENGLQGLDMTDLANLSHVLKVPVDDFFKAIPAMNNGSAEFKDDYDDAGRMVELFVKIENPAVRHDLVSLIRSLGRSLPS